MPDFAKLTQRLREGHHLAPDEVAAAVELLTSPTDAPEAKAEFLTALSAKGETTGELAAFAFELRQRSITVPTDATTRSRPILDVCGTGGDRLNTFNISTAVALLCAAAGVTVAKHGNRAITSQSGSADVLEALGIRVDLTPAEAADSLRDHNFAFFFAIKYHPAFQHIAPARKLCAERGQRTIFNIIGPLLNPARPTVQLVGVPRPQFCEPVAAVLQQLGLHRAMVVCGQAGDAFLDELSTIGPSTASQFHTDDRPVTSSISPADVGIPYATLKDLEGGDKFANAAIIRAILDGTERGPKRDAVLLNAAAALYVAGKSNSLKAGLEDAIATIDTGAAAAKLRALSSL
jgi:anthranilate phosphoribosyltransferase